MMMASPPFCHYVSFFITDAIFADFRHYCHFHFTLPFHARSLPRDAADSAIDAIDATMPLRYYRGLIIISPLR